MPRTIIKYRFNLLNQGKTNKTLYVVRKLLVPFIQACKNEIIGPKRKMSIKQRINQ